MNIKELAEQAGYLPDMFGIGHWDMPEFKRFAELILEQERKEAAEHYLKMIRDCVAAERERCAALIEEVGKQTAAAIRSRGDKHE